MYMCIIIHYHLSGLLLGLLLLPTRLVVAEPGLGAPQVPRHAHALDLALLPGALQVVFAELAGTHIEAVSVGQVPHGVVVDYLQALAGHDQGVVVVFVIDHHRPVLLLLLLALPARHHGDVDLPVLAPADLVPVLSAAALPQ